ncbi:MAG: type II secretion system protein [Candidatus Daviesbacteria bacterium]|nr:type II secretion system protein [Candidatus Daviesbacteria bacterium]
MIAKKGFSAKREACGFTLVELLVVVAILSVIGALTYTYFGSVTKSSRDNRRLNDLNNVKNGLELYRHQNRSYPKLLEFPCKDTIPANTINKNLDPLPEDVNCEVLNYRYIPSPSTCIPDTSSIICTGYVLCASKESDKSFPTVTECDNEYLSKIGVASI